LFEFITRGSFPGVSINLGVFGLVLLYLVLFIVTTTVVIGGIIGIVGFAVTGFLAILVGSVAVAPAMLIGLITLVIIAIVLIVHIFRIIWTILRAFVNIVLLTIFAPLQLTLGAIMPSMGFGSWVKSYISNLAVFVVVGVLFLLSFWFLDQAGSTAYNQLGQEVDLFGLMFNIPRTLVIRTPSTSYWPPLLMLSGATPQALAFLYLIVSLVIFAIIPKSAELIQSTIQGRPFGFGSAIGATVGPALWLGGQARRATWDSMTGREIREQAAAISGYRLVERAQKGLDTMWPGRFQEESFINKLLDRMKRRAGM
jgi:hypothetical protein